MHFKNIAFYIKKAWFAYKNFVEDALQAATPYPITEKIYWREKLFINSLIYAIPLSLIAIIPSIIISLQDGYYFVIPIDLIFIGTITLVAVNKWISLNLRIAYVVVMIYAMAVVMTNGLGSFGIGSIYLLGVSVFITQLYPVAIAYYTVCINMLIYAAFAAIIYFKPFHSPLTDKYSFSMWVACSSNFLFLNLLSVIINRLVITRLESTIVEEVKLLKALQQETNEKIARNKQLEESEAHYRSLFYYNPVPMWIFDNDTGQILQANIAAVKKYGYSKDEFLSMSMEDIRVDVDIDSLLQILKSDMPINASALNIGQHRRRDGELFYVEARQSNLPFNGKNARLVIARDITQQILHLDAIERQNIKLREIAYMQSHVVRAPLSRILGLTSLIIEEAGEGANQEMLAYLDISARELDEVIKSIIQGADENVHRSVFE